MEGGGAMMMCKAEIDTSAPFRSVKEAVMLFGERVLASEVYANKLKELQDGTNEYNQQVIEIELEETKQSLEKAREESMQMAQCLSSLQQELEQTKRELQQLKTRELEKCLLDLDIEDLKFVEDKTQLIEQVKKETTSTATTTVRDKGVNFQKKKYVTFANPPLVAQVIVPPPPPPTHEAVLQRHPSLKKKKKKPLIPLIGGLFSRKKGSNEIAFA